MASALENYVSNVRILSASGSYRELSDMHIKETLDLLLKNWSILDNVLETLDMQQHSLGVLYVLMAKFRNHSQQNSTACETQLLNLFDQFIQLCNGEQVRFSTSSFYELCHMYTNNLIKKPHNVQQLINGSKILAMAIERIQMNEGQLTPVHSDLCLLALKAKYFRIAIQLLNIDISSISTSSDGHSHNSTQETNNDAKYFLLYYYYGGMIYTAIKHYDRALYFFEVCISTPAMAMSHIMLEAYKKFLMVSLILHGKIQPIPKYSWQVISRFMKPLAQVYLDLSSAYTSSSSDELRHVIIKFGEVIRIDNNMGLVKLVATSLVKENIKRLTKTFLTLSLSDVASRVQLNSAAEAEKYILNMIKSGEIYATINQKDGMIVFNDDPENFNSPEMFEKIQKDITKVVEMMKHINEMEEEILLNPIYVKKVMGTQEEETTAAAGSKAFTSTEPAME